MELPYRPARGCAPQRPMCVGVSHAGERDRFRCAPRPLSSSRGITARGHNDGSPLTPLSTYSRTTPQLPITQTRKASPPAVSGPAGRQHRRSSVPRTDHPDLYHAVSSTSIAKPRGSAAMRAVAAGVPTTLWDERQTRQRRAPAQATSEGWCPAARDIRWRSCSPPPRSPGQDRGRERSGRPGPRAERERCPASRL